MRSQRARPNIIGIVGVVETSESDKIEGLHFVSNAGLCGLSNSCR